MYQDRVPAALTISREPQERPSPEAIVFCLFHPETGKEILSILLILSNADFSPMPQNAGLRRLSSPMSFGLPCISMVQEIDDVSGRLAQKRFVP